MLDVKKLKELIKLMVTNDLTELDLQGDGERVTLKRGPGDQKVHYVPTAAPVLQAGEPNGTPPTNGTATPPAVGQGQADQEAGDTGLEQITSPMVGTFYAASSPDAAPFVTVGDRVDPEKVVCIIEAMKVFNEIKAEATGTIEKILVQTGQAVEFDQPLFLVRPD